MRLDLNSVIFPLEGETFCTGIEFVLAMNLKCEIEILGGVFIPFKPSKTLETKQQDQKEQREQKEIKEFKEFKDFKKVKEIYVKDPQINQVETQLEKHIRNQLNVIEKDVNNNNNNSSNNNNINVNSLSVKDGNENEDEYLNSNFYSIVKELMLERLKYPKGSYMNLLYKFLANSGIGQMARGLNQKVRYDSQTNSTKILPSGDLVSPLYAG